MDQIYLVCLFLGSVFLLFAIFFTTKGQESENDRLFLRPFVIALLFGAGGMIANSFVETDLLRFAFAFGSALTFPFFEGGLASWLTS